MKKSFIYYLFFIGITTSYHTHKTMNFHYEEIKKIPEQRKELQKERVPQLPLQQEGKHLHQHRDTNNPLVSEKNNTFHIKKRAFTPTTYNKKKEQGKEQESEQSIFIQQPVKVMYTRTTHNDAEKKQVKNHSYDLPSPPQLQFLTNNKYEENIEKKYKTDKTREELNQTILFHHFYTQNKKENQPPFISPQEQLNLQRKNTSLIDSNQYIIKNKTLSTNNDLLFPTDQSQYTDSSHYKENKLNLNYTIKMLIKEKKRNFHLAQIINEEQELRLFGRLNIDTSLLAIDKHYDKEAYEKRLPKIKRYFDETNAYAEEIIRRRDRSITSFIQFLKDIETLKRRASLPSNKNL